MMKRITAIGLGIALLAGCAPKQVPPPEPEPDPMAVEVPADASERVRQLRSSADQLASFADQLPGANESIYRERMSQAMESLAQGIRLARGPWMDGAFRVRLHTMFEAARQLRARPIDYRMEPHVTSALRSAHSALREIARDQFAASAELSTQLEDLEASLRPLETDRGALHRVSSSNTLRLAVKTLQTMGDLYSARIPTTAPTTQVVVPAEAPEAAETTETPAATPPDGAEPAEPAKPAATPTPTPESPATAAPATQPREELNK